MTIPLDTMLEGREGQTAEPAPTYRLRPSELWRIPDALRRVAELLQLHPNHLALERCLPPIPQNVPDRPIRLRAALANTFVAGLEMARHGGAELVQTEPFGLLALRAVDMAGHLEAKLQSVQA
ncbi:hypothetical protein ACFQX4_24300 [Roseomonas sp. GCM10028921]